MPRTVVALAVGMALGTAGLLMQGLAQSHRGPRHPGRQRGCLVRRGALDQFLGASDPATFIWFAIAGAALATVLVHVLSRGRQRLDDPVRLVLAGAVISMLLQAGVSAVLVNDVETLDRYRFWTVGSLSEADPAVLVMLLPLLVVGGVIAVLATRSMDALALGMTWPARWARASGSCGSGRHRAHRVRGRAGRPHRVRGSGRAPRGAPWSGRTTDGRCLRHRGRHPGAGSGHAGAPGHPARGAPGGHHDRAHRGARAHPPGPSPQPVGA